MTRASGRSRTMTRHPAVSVADLSIPEGDTGTTNASLTVALSAPSGKPIWVDYSTADGSADSFDYAGISGTVLLAPGETSRTVDVAVSGDRTYEPDETFTFALQNPVNATLGSTPAAVTIQNDDAIPQISIDDQTVPEGDSSTTNATLTISLSNPSSVRDHRRLRHGRRHGHVPGRLHERGRDRLVRSGRYHQDLHRAHRGRHPATSSTRRSSPTSRTRRTPRSPTTRGSGRSRTTMPLHRSRSRIRPSRRAMPAAPPRRSPSRSRQFRVSRSPSTTRPRMQRRAPLPTTRVRQAPSRSLPERRSARWTSRCRATSWTSSTRRSRSTC